LLQIDAEHVHHAERHRQRQRNGERHQHRGAPFPKTDERDEHHEKDRFVQAAHEQIDVLGDLQRLVGSAGENQIFGQAMLDIGERLVDGFAEFADLLAGPHLNGERDGAGTLPVGLLVAPRVKIHKARRAVIAAIDLHQIAQVNRRAVW